MPFGADFRWVATMITGLIVGIATLSAGLVLGTPSIAVVGAALTQLGPAAGVRRADARRAAPRRTVSRVQSRLRGQCRLVMFRRTSGRLAEEGT
jgi:hypothetical protein